MADVMIAGLHHLVLVRELEGQSGRAYLAYDSRRLQVRGKRQIVSFLFGLAVVMVIALWGARRLAQQALQPLAGLVGQIRVLDPEQRAPRLVAADDPDLAVITEALNTYMARFDAVVERERVFSSAASHELRTPLTVIRGAVELLVARVRSDPSRPLARISRAVAQAQADLDALLALSRLREPPTSRVLDLDTLLPEWPSWTTPPPRAGLAAVADPADRLAGQRARDLLQPAAQTPPGPQARTVR